MAPRPQEVLFNSSAVRIDNAWCGLDTVLLLDKEHNLTQDDPLRVSVVMGSQSDWPTMKLGAAILDDFGVPHESRVVSAHRTPQLMVDFAKDAESRGIQVIIAGAGGAAHLPGMIASLTTLPVLGVPIKSRALSGLDSLLSIVQMPGGIPVGTLAIGDAGAKNAALLAIRILAKDDTALRQQLVAFHERQAKLATSAVLQQD